MNTYTYEIKPHQRKIIEDFNKLNLRRLHYLVIQQDRKQPNFTLNELKKHIKGGIKNYVKEVLGYRYKNGDENKLINYYCFFETSKEVFLNQHRNYIVKEDIWLDLHFHLFITTNSGFLHIPQLISRIILEFFNQRLKVKSLKKIDYTKIDTLNNDFILYHTKQSMYRSTPEMIMKNI
jgi:hypothetical protein